jgi:hypothetical protein
VKGLLEVVLRATGFVFQGVVCFRNAKKRGESAGVRVFIRVVLKSQQSVGFRNLGVRGNSRYAEYAVKVVCHLEVL